MGAAIGAAVASALIAKLLEKTAGKLWKLKESDLKKSIASAVAAAHDAFAMPFIQGRGFGAKKIKELFFRSDTMEAELEKIILKAHDIPNVNTLYVAFQDAAQEVFEESEDNPVSSSTGSALSQPVRSKRAPSKMNVCH